MRLYSVSASQFSEDSAHIYQPSAGWTGNKPSSYDWVVKRAGDRFLALIKNTYRVLLTRGMKGCYVCFLDKATENFFRSRTEAISINYPETAEDQERQVAED